MHALVTVTAVVVAVAVATYAGIGVTGSTLLPRFLAPFATLWHIALFGALAVVAILIWRSRPTVPEAEMQKRATAVGGFSAALAIALANPADIVLFAALFTALGISVHTPLEHALFFGTFLAGGVTYWIALAFLLDRWRAGLTTSRLVWLNRACSALMMVGAAASLASLVRTT